MVINKKISPSIKKSDGFTQQLNESTGFSLIELLVVVAMLAVLFLAVLLTFNPLTQYNKTQDSKREHDLGQIQRALDSYYNDRKCYPTALLFNTQWFINGQVYMEKIPQDPNCTSDPNRCYVYQTDGSSCPQWSVLYASLRGPTGLQNACILEKKTACLPNGYVTNKYNYCVASGTVDCAFISSSSIGPLGGGGGPTPTPGGATPTPGGATPTGVIYCPSGSYYACTGDNRCNSVAPPSQCAGLGGTLVCHCDIHCDQACLYN